MIILVVKQTSKLLEKFSGVKRGKNCIYLVTIKLPNYFRPNIENKGKVISY